jgi:hypothetical protein
MAAPVIVAMVDDLMDRSRLSAAIADVVFARTVEACAGADVVVVDLVRHGAWVAAVRAAVPGARIVAFGPHVDEDAFAQARADGADLALARSAFFRDPAAVVT